MRLLYFLFSLIFILSNFSGFTQGKTSRYNKAVADTNKKSDPWAEFDVEQKDSVRKLEFGLNFGAYFANKYSANFYNGTRENVNNVTYVMKNSYWYQDIKRALVASDTVMVYNNPYQGETGYPVNMHYTVAFTGGLFLRYNIDRKNGIFLQASYTRLTAADILVLHVDPIPNILTNPDLRYVPIIGKEGRVLIDLGYQRSFPMKSKIYFFVQAAATMCYTQMIRSYFSVEGVDYNMVNIYGDNQGYVPGYGSQTFTVNQNAFGFGGNIGGGIGIPLTDNFGLEPSFFMQYYSTNLIGYAEYKPSFGILLRIMINFSKPEGN